MYVDTDGSGDEEEDEMVIKEEGGQEDFMEVKEVVSLLFYFITKLPLTLESVLRIKETFNVQF